jgi:hypothetical protein
MNLGKEVHFEIHASEIHAFVQRGNNESICFRCGEANHMRNQCMSWKVRECDMFKTGLCTRENCPFAHGKEELRTPWKRKCIRVIRQAGTLVCIGCKSDQHTFKKCPYSKDLLFPD